MSKLDKDTVINNFTQAFTTANGKAPAIEANGGWYSVDGGKNMRLAQLEEMTAELNGAKAKPAKATKVKKPTPKKKAAKTFSVKDFYTQQIIDANPGAKAPR
jgi:hypothetical protein